MMPIYAGTFDPLTRGHISVIRRMSVMFGGGVVLVAVNPDKAPLFTPVERLKLIQESLREERIFNIGCSYTTGYVADWASYLHPLPSSVVLVRGIRAPSETKYELEIADFNRERKGIETIFLPAETEMAGISSSFVRNLAESAHHDELLQYVTPTIAAALIERVQKPV